LLKLNDIELLLGPD